MEVRFSHIVILFMDTSADSKSVFGLLLNLTRDVKVFFQEEVELGKTEFFEKLSCMGRNAGILAASGAVAVIGVLMLISGLGWLVAYAFSKAGLAPLMAAFLGQACLGILIIIAGTMMLLRAKSMISETSLKPKKTLETLQGITGETAKSTLAEPEKAPSSEELKQHIEKLEGRLGETVHELGNRFSPHHLNEEVRHRIQAKPYSAGMLAIGAGFISALVLTRRPKHA